VQQTTALLLCSAAVRDNTGCIKTEASLSEGEPELHAHQRVVEDHRNRRVRVSGKVENCEGSKKVDWISAVSKFFSTGHPVWLVSNYEGIFAGSCKCGVGTKQFSHHINKNVRACSCTPSGHICLHTASKTTSHVIYCHPLPLFKSALHFFK
jgi:hypothetical protein